MDTLALNKARPLTSNIDFSSSRLRWVTTNYQMFKTGDTLSNPLVDPASEALWFYVQQHAMGLAGHARHAHEPLGDYAPFVDRYHRDMKMKALRMFYYLLLICTRESRHANNGAGLTKLYDHHPDIADYHKHHVQDAGHESAIASMFSNTPDVSLGDYTEFLVRVFTYCNYGSQFGGAKWAAIARPLRDFVAGKISAEIMLDTAFTLEHNNGNIFNKGMLYNKTNKAPLHMILDGQRAGQIPQLIMEPPTRIEKYVTEPMQNYVRSFSALEAGFKGPVDWTKIFTVTGAPYQVPTKPKVPQAPSMAITSNLTVLLGDRSKDHYAAS